MQQELQTQLHESQRSCAQLRTQVTPRSPVCCHTAAGRRRPVCLLRPHLQILVYEGEMARAQGQLEAQMQNLEEEKNRVIEEAFIRAESEMKAVHENLAGQWWRLRCDWLSLVASVL